MADWVTSQRHRFDGYDDLAEGGEMMTHRLAKEIIKAHQPPQFSIAAAPHAPHLKTPQRDHPPPHIDRQIEVLLSAAMAIKEASERSGLTMNQKQKIARMIEVLLSLESERLWQRHAH